MSRRKTNFDNYVIYRYTFRSLSGRLLERIFILRMFDLLISMPYAAGFIDINKDDPHHEWCLHPVVGGVELAAESLYSHLLAEKITPERVVLCGRLMWREDTVTNLLWENDKGLPLGVSCKSHINYYKPSPITDCINADACSKVKNVIFEGPATIVEFLDGDKVVVKKEKDAADDKEKAIMYAICQKNCGMSKTKFHKWMEEIIQDAMNKERDRAFKKRNKALKKNKE